MKKEDVLKILQDIGEEMYVERLEGDLTIEDMLQLGYTDSGARRVLNKLVTENKMVKLKTKVPSGSPINIYRKIVK